MSAVTSTGNTSVGSAVSPDAGGAAQRNRDAAQRDAGAAQRDPGFRQGDFVTQLVQHQRRIYAFIGSLVHHQADIEDLYQQTCLVLWKKHDQFDGDRDFFPWACGIAKHEIFNHLRKRDKRGRVYLSEQVLSEIAEEHLRTESEGDARRELLDGCLAKLREPQRNLLRRCYEGTHTIKEIAADMRISPAALTMRLQRIKQSVLTCLEKSLAAGGRR